jgi:hypothetical protein
MTVILELLKSGNLRFTSEGFDEAERTAKPGQ